MFYQKNLSGGDKVTSRLSIKVQCTMVQKNTVIDLKKISVIFNTKSGDFLAVDRVSLEVKSGEFICLLGPSGCGKSTVLNAIAGFEPYAGTISVLGNPVFEPGPERGMVFQQPNLFPWRTVRGNIGHGPRMRGKSNKEVNQITDNLISVVGLTKFSDSYPHMLSGGMQQRVALARALANEPKVLLMDEPFGALDAQTRSIMQEHLLSIWTRLKTTIVFVTHDVEEAIFLADRVFIMTASPGRIKSSFSVDLDRPRNIETLSSQTFLKLRQHCLEEIREESARAFSQQGMT